MTVGAGQAAALAELLLWDAPFLPLPTEFGGGNESAGEPLGRLVKGPLGIRAAVALQLLAAAEFLVARGWYPERELFRGARVLRAAAGPTVVLARLPRWRPEDKMFRTPAGQGLLGVDALAARLVLPVLVTLLPERQRELGAAVARALPGSAAEALADVIRGCGRAGAFLEHRQGVGRALWARRLHLPRNGVVWVEEDELLPRLLAAAELQRRAGRRPGLVAGGRLDENDVAIRQAALAASGEPGLVLTTLPVSGAAPLTIEPEEGAIWTFRLTGGDATVHMQVAHERSGGRARVVAEVLAAGASRAFVEPPEPGADLTEREGLASAAARSALAWLAAVPVGLDAAECEAVGIAAETRAELLRLGLAQNHGQRWRITPAAARPSEERLRTLATALPDGSLARMVAEALTGGSWTPLEQWCAVRLGEEESALEVLDLARAMPPGSPLALWGAEAALVLGRLSEAAKLLAAVPAERRRGAWQVLQAWWALLAGVPQQAGEALATAGDSEPRLAARRALIAAELANQRGDSDQERRFLEEAARSRGALADEAALHRAALAGAAALRQLRRQAWSRWSRALKVRYLHLLGLDAFRRGREAATGTALRAGLRLCSGLNPLTLGELCADLATLHLARDRPASAERYYGLAQTQLERAGCQRALFIVRANRAVVANDLMRWRQAQELLKGLVPPPGEGAALHEAANAVELARCELVRGRLEPVRAALPRLQAACKANPAWVLLSLAVSSLRLHLLLAEGDLDQVEEAAAGAEESDRILAAAMLAGQRGLDPDPAPPPRWGVAPCAAILAAWRRGEGEVARDRAARFLARAPREGAVALARLVRLLGRAGERLDESWAGLLRRAEEVLQAADLDGWAACLRAVERTDPVALTRALVGALTAGTACTDRTYLEPLARALGIHRLELWRGDRRLGAWGDGEAEDGAIATAGVTVRWGGAVDAVVRVALEGLARVVGSQGEPSGEDVRMEGGLVGRSAALQRVRELIVRWGPLPFPVLITGEPGTGKELVARELHRISRRRGAFLPINCAALPTHILERELFGAVRGAFTGAEEDREGLVEAAEGGTLFLDEIGELPLELQAKLLRLLQEREVRRLGSTRVKVVDVRFLAATNRDLAAAAARREFRADLYYRLAAAVIHVPPLRERPEDIEELAVLFCQRAARECDRPGVRLAPAALEALRQAAWPGNARELEWVVRRAVVAAGAGEVLGPERFGVVAPAPAPPLESFAAARDRFLTEYFTALLAASGGNRSEAARRAGLTRQGLLYHLRSLGLRGQ